jgi:hypothetical protein
VRSKVEARIGPSHPGDGPGMSGGGSTMVSYRLDDRWMLSVWYTDRVEPFTVITRKLVDDLRELWIEPPPKFSGVWTTYFVNGQRAHEIHYQAGSYHGTFTSFHHDGTKSVVQSYGPSGADGDDLGFYPSGKPAYRGQYRAGKQVGVWTFYAEDGSIKSTEDHDAKQP